MFSLKIREVRIRENLTIEELSAKSKVSYAMISRYELGKSDITLSKLLSIANALNVKYWELIDLEKDIQENFVKENSTINNIQDEKEATINAISQKIINSLKKQFFPKLADLENSVSDLLHDIEGLEVKVNEMDSSQSSSQSSDSKEA